MPTTRQYVRVPFRLLALATVAVLAPVAQARAETTPAPAISIGAYGPATAVSGELLTYTFAVSDTGQSSFAAAEVLVVGSACQTPAAIVNHGADLSVGTLDPGDAWTYQCQVQTTPGASELVMAGRAAATDASGSTASAAQSFTTPLAAARTSVSGLHLRSGGARISTVAGCTRARMSASISGSRIGYATFFLDGRLVRRVVEPDAAGRFTLFLDPQSLSARRHVIRVHVVFEVDSRTASRTLVTHVRGCTAQRG
ncbi:MAG TPA: hypothetical protein VII98_06160 [Solirubrobacteraceae bacterium]